MQNCIGVSILLLCTSGILLNISEYNKNDFYKIKITNTTVLTKEILNDMMEIKKIKLTNNLVNGIAYGVLGEAQNAKNTYEWKDTENTVDDVMFQNVINKLNKIFPDIRIRYLSRSTIENLNILYPDTKLNYYSSIKLTW